MNHNIAQNAGPIAENVKVQAAAAIATTGFGLGTFFDYLPDVLGVVGTMSGIMLTWVMICKLMLEIKLKKQTIKEDK